MTKYLAIAIGIFVTTTLFIFTTALAFGEQLTWDEVSKNTDGSPAGPIIYHVYVKKDAGPFLFLASKILNLYTWTEPKLNEYYFVVRAANKNGESADSNVLHLQSQCSWSVVP